MTDPIALIMRESARSDLIALAFELRQVALANKTFALGLPETWADAFDGILAALGSLSYHKPGNAYDFAILASGYQGATDAPYHQTIRDLDALGFHQHAKQVAAYRDLARDTDLPLTGEDNEDLPRVGEDVQAALNELQGKWEALADATPVEGVLERIAQLIPLDFRPDAEFDAYWLDRITRSDVFPELFYPDKRWSWDRHGVEKWRADKRTTDALAQSGVEPGIRFWTGQRNDRIHQNFVTSNKGVLKMETQLPDRGLQVSEWPGGTRLVDVPPAEKTVIKSRTDMQTRMEFNAINRRLSAASNASRLGPLTPAMVGLRHRKDLGRHQYLVGTMGASNRMLLGQLFQIGFALVALGYVLLATRHIERVGRMLAGELDSGMALVTAAVSLLMAFLVLELSWRLPAAVALIRGTVDRARGHQPMHDSFAGTTYNKSNVLLRLLGHRD